MSQWFANFTAADWIAVIALVTSVGGPFIVYWLGRRYTDKQFEVTNFPEAKFDLLFTNSEFPISRSVKTVVPVYLEVKARTVTQVEAVDVRMRITLAKGMTQVWWNSPRESLWKVLPPYADNTMILGLSLQAGVEALLPNVFEIQVDTAKATYSKDSVREFLKLRGGQVAPSILMLVEFSWSPPLRTKKRLFYRRLIEVQFQIDHQEVTYWECRYLSSRFMRLRMWRPNRKELQQPNDY